jgi:hypothetical protein
VIRNGGRYLTEHKTTVSVFYVSNLETYLDDTQKRAFYANVTTLPMDSSGCLSATSWVTRREPCHGGGRV